MQEIVNKFLKKIEKVTLNGIGVGKKEFEISHAQNLLNLQRKNPPIVWKLEDTSYEIKEGVITKKEESPTKEINP